MGPPFLILTVVGRSQTVCGCCHIRPLSVSAFHAAAHPVIAGLGPCSLDLLNIRGPVPGPRRHQKYTISGTTRKGQNSSHAWSRTRNLAINSRPLCRLSYTGMMMGKPGDRYSWRLPARARPGPLPFPDEFRGTVASNRPKLESRRPPGDWGYSTGSGA